jgi:hypothetical protein
MIAENLKIVEAKIAEKCGVLGRKREEIKLIAVSKTQPLNVIKDAFSAGLSIFGENKAQELRDKAQAVDFEVSWHFIGHLQSNKIKYIINAAEYIHSVDSLKLAEEINRRAEQIGKIQKILLEIKTSDEATKFGLSSENEILTILEACADLSNIKVEGFMTMAPYTDDNDLIRSCFRKLKASQNFVVKHGFDVKELSMGMTNDYEIAVEEGATMLRLGTAIFGDRN